MIISVSQVVSEYTTALSISKRNMSGCNMTEIIMNPFYDTFMELCTKSQERIMLCAPYIKSDVIADILQKKQSRIPVDMITKVNLRDYHNKVSDLEALHHILLDGGRVYNCSNLHAKAYIFDDTLCAITSANLTISGLSRNAECGVITDDTGIVNEVLGFYNGIVEREDVGRISAKNVREISELLIRIPPVSPIVWFPRLYTDFLAIMQKLCKKPYFS